jgi:3-methylfumaryl-CoA hydratase
LAAESVITEELNGLLNKEFGPEVYEIEKGMLKRFAEAIDDPDPRWLTEAPPTFACSLVPKKLLNVILNAEIPLKKLLNGSSELEYLKPIKAGDVISVTAKLTRLRQVQGAAGPTLFMFTEMTFTNQNGEVVVKGKNTYVKY